VTKSDLVLIVAQRNPHLFYEEVDSIVDTILEDMTAALEGGNRVELRGFGTFSVRHRLPHTGRNPRTGESVVVKERWVPFFKTGKDLHERMNPGVVGDV
jgi:integration host factor subunit beta